MHLQTAPKLAAPIVQAIEEAVLLGNIREIDGVLDLVREDAMFPAELRNALESLMYFRMIYGRGGELEPQDGEDRLRAQRMESNWGREIIEMIGHYPDLAEARYYRGT